MSKKKPYYYSVYGLRICSELELPELVSSTIASTQSVDINIALGKLPENLKSITHKRKHRQLNSQECLFEVEHIARYYAKKGSSIKVSPYANVAPGDVRLYLLGTMLGAILHQRHDFPLHCSAILFPAQQQKLAIAFCGDSGAGKSTLLHSFVKRNFKVLGDDVGVIRQHDASTLFYPGFPRIKLWQDALEHFTICNKNLIKDLLRSDKYHLNIEPSFSTEPAQLTAIIELQTGADFSLTRQYGIDAIHILMRNTYRPGMLKHMGKQKQHFSRCAQLLKQTQVFRFQRPRSLDKLEQGIDFIEQNLRLQME